MTLRLMTAVLVLTLLATGAAAYAKDKVIVVQNGATVDPAAPQIVIKSKGPLESSPMYPVFRDNPYGAPYVPPKDRRERTTFTDSNGVTYEVTKYYQYDDDGNERIQTITRDPNGYETETIQQNSTLK